MHPVRSAPARPHRAGPVPLRIPPRPRGPGPSPPLSREHPWGARGADGHHFNVGERQHLDPALFAAIVEHVRDEHLEARSFLVWTAVGVDASGLTEQARTLGAAGLMEQRSGSGSRCEAEPRRCRVDGAESILASTPWRCRPVRPPSGPSWGIPSKARVGPASAAPPASSRWRRGERSGRRRPIPCCSLPEAGVARGGRGCSSARQTTRPTGRRPGGIQRRPIQTWTVSGVVERGASETPRFPPARPTP